MATLVALVFALVYLGMILGRFPGFALDRTGVALLGAIVLVAVGAISPADAWLAIDVPTIALLFGLMVVSAQFRLGGAYAALTRRIAALPIAASSLLALMIAAAAILSSVLANDVVCLAMTPLVIEGCLRRGWRPLPFLLGLACAANVGSAATLIGNPQNMLIGQTLRLDFASYLGEGLVPAVLGSVATWAVIVRSVRGEWAGTIPPIEAEPHAFSLWQTAKGSAVLVVLVALFVFAPAIPREVAALAAAGVLLLSRRMHSRRMLGLVDWQLLVLFAGLFVVHRALATTGLVEGAYRALVHAGIDLSRGPVLFAASVVLSNIVSNVPAVMLLLPAALGESGAAILAISSTLAGNLLLVGSIANLIVADQAARLGVGFSWKEHARVGVPVTLITLAIAAAWLSL